MFRFNEKIASSRVRSRMISAYEGLSTLTQARAYCNTLDKSCEDVVDTMSQVVPEGYLREAIKRETYDLLLIEIGKEHYTAVLLLNQPSQTWLSKEYKIKPENDDCMSKSYEIRNMLGIGNLYDHRVKKRGRVSYDAAWKPVMGAVYDILIGKIWLDPTSYEHNEARTYDPMLPFTRVGGKKQQTEQPRPGGIRLLIQEQFAPGPRFMRLSELEAKKNMIKDYSSCLTYGCDRDDTQWLPCALRNAISSEKYRYLFRMHDKTMGQWQPRSSLTNERYARGIYEHGIDMLLKKRAGSDFRTDGANDVEDVFKSRRARNLSFQAVSHVLQPATRERLESAEAYTKFSTGRLVPLESMREVLQLAELRSDCDTEGLEEEIFTKPEGHKFLHPDQRFMDEISLYEARCLGLSTCLYSHHTEHLVTSNKRVAVLRAPKVVEMPEDAYESVLDARTVMNERYVVEDFAEPHPRRSCADPLFAHTKFREIRELPKITLEDRIAGRWHVQPVEMTKLPMQETELMAVSMIPLEITSASQHMEYIQKVVNNTDSPNGNKIRIYTPKTAGQMIHNTETFCAIFGELEDVFSLELQRHEGYISYSQCDVYSVKVIFNPNKFTNVHAKLSIDLSDPEIEFDAKEEGVDRLHFDRLQEMCEEVKMMGARVKTRNVDNPYPELKYSQFTSHFYVSSIYMKEHTLVVDAYIVVHLQGGYTKYAFTLVLFGAGEMPPSPMEGSVRLGATATMLKKSWVPSMTAARIARNLLSTTMTRNINTRLFKNIVPTEAMAARIFLVLLYIRQLQYEALVREKPAKDEIVHFTYVFKKFLDKMLSFEEEAAFRFGSRSIPVSAICSSCVDRKFEKQLRLGQAGYDRLVATQLQEVMCDACTARKAFIVHESVKLLDYLRISSPTSTFASLVAGKARYAEYERFKVELDNMEPFYDYVSRCYS